MKRKYETRLSAEASAKAEVTSHESQKRPGSALILTVVLTSLLAIVGVLFVLVSRLDKLATSGLSENKELNSAVDTVIAKISQELASDVPAANEEYYDYPDSNNAWLACLEPYQYGIGDYRWRRISDIYGVLDANDLQAKIINDYQPNIVADANADADGDGVSDAVWVKIPHITSSKGKPIYAAVRIVDNGGMLNVNTAYRFDPDGTEPNIDGSSQMQINLAALSQRGVSNGTPDTAADKLQNWRCGNESNNLTLYKPNVIWQYYDPNGEYTPFDIGDELKLRNRYILNYNKITTRIEKLWRKVYDWGLDMPRNKNDHSISEPNDWFWYVNNSSLDPNKYDYRHISTTYNMDRIIGPDGGKMVNVNRVDEPNYLGDLYQAMLKSGLDGITAAQIAVNLKDFVDDDNYVTRFPAPDGNTYYGFERPCIYISEIAYRSIPNPPPPKRSYAVELYKPYEEDKSPVGWRLVVGGTTIDINNPTWNKDKSFYVILSENSYAKFDSNSISSSIADVKKDTPFTFICGVTTVDLQRRIPDGNYITVDSILVPAGLAVDGQPHSIQRDIGTNILAPTKHKCIRQLWDTSATTPTLGNNNSVTVGSATLIQAHPANKNFTNIGEIGMILRKSAYSQGPNPIGQADTEATARLNLADPNFQQLFNYLTVFDPSSDGINNDGDFVFIDPIWLPIVDEGDNSEWKIPGRLNINTAPWFVIAQLPWVSQRKAGYNNSALAQAIAGYRDTVAGGFKSIGQLNNITDPNLRDYGMNYYALDLYDLDDFPDLSSGDGAINDFEERDVIFARISNLITVRSDVFTAYILVRIGNDGPQKRVMAILDRSNVYSPRDKVRIIALHPVPDPR